MKKTQKIETSLKLKIMNQYKSFKEIVSELDNESDLEIQISTSQKKMQLKKIHIPEIRLYETTEFRYSCFLNDWWQRFQWERYNYPLKILNSFDPDNDFPKLKGQIAISRTNILFVNEQGQLIALRKNDESSLLAEQREGCFQGSKVVRIAATESGFAVLYQSGLVSIEKELSHQNSVSYDYQQTEVAQSDLLGCGNMPTDLYRESNIKDIVACEGHLAVMLSDGSVKCHDICGWTRSPNHSEVLHRWGCVAQVAMGYYNIMALTSEGKVLYHCESKEDTSFYDACENVVQVDCNSVYYGTDYAAALHADGTVTSHSFEAIKDWHDIVQIAVNERYIAGLKRDGTVVVATENMDQETISVEWKDMVYIECKFYYLVGITREGDVKIKLLSY